MLSRTMELAMWARAMSFIFMLSEAVLVDGTPWLGPDLTHCRPVTDHYNPDPQICCELDARKTISDFKFDADLPMRTRRPAHKFDGELLSKYEQAFALMKALPNEDPRSFHAQKKMHCGYALGAYNIANSTEAFPVHGNWHFCPFHRWFLYFYERILAKLVGDDTLAIPYWAWDVQNETTPPANAIPAMFTNPNSPLFDSKRTKINQPPARVNLDRGFADDNSTIDPEVLMRRNYNILWQNLVNVHPQSVFYGGNSTTISLSLMGSFEKFHVPPHFWIGEEDGFHEDMGPSYSAASDPIFFSHHAETDRLWEVWRRLGGGLLDDSDWLDSEYFFYDENADLVRVRVRDCLDNEKLRVSYEDLPADWLDYEPTSIRERGDPKYAHTSPLGRMWSTVRDSPLRQTVATTVAGLFSSREEAKVLSFGGRERRGGREPVTYHVARPKPSARSSASEFNEVLVATILVTKPLEVDLGLYVFVELPEADETTPRDCAESLGSIFLDSMGQKVKHRQKFAMGNRLRILGVGHEPSLAITFVPVWDRRYDADVSAEIIEVELELHAMAPTP